MELYYEYRAGDVVESSGYGRAWYGGDRDLFVRLEIRFHRRVRVVGDRIPPPIVSEGGVFGTGNASDTVAKNYKEEEKKKVMEAGEGGADISLLPFARWIDRIPSCHDDVEDDAVELV